MSKRAAKRKASATTKEEEYETVFDAERESGAVCGEPLFTPAQLAENRMLDFKLEYLCYNAERCRKAATESTDNYIIGEFELRDSRGVVTHGARLTFSCVIQDGAGLANRFDSVRLALFQLGADQDPIVLSQAFNRYDCSADVALLSSGVGDQLDFLYPVSASALLSASAQVIRNMARLIFGFVTAKLRNATLTAVEHRAVMTIRERLTTFLK